MITLLICLGVLALPVVDSLVGRLIWRHSTPIRIDSYESEASDYISIVFPGFSNPLQPFGEGMHRLLKVYGRMYIVGYDTTVTVERIVAAVMEKLKSIGTSHNLIIYGHSMGGIVGEYFRTAYEKAGSPYGPIKLFLLDCSPDGGQTGKFPGGRTLAKSLLAIWRGGPVLSLIAALGNVISRIRMPVRVDTTHSPELYRRYARGIMWFPSRDWAAQLRFLLRVGLPQGTATTQAYVVYVGAYYPQRDTLVDQPWARDGWRRRHLGIHQYYHSAVGHAWPVERAWDYAEIIQEHLDAAIQS